MKLTGNFIGVVLQNNDPEKRGRVKVFIPHISATVYEKWNKKNIDKDFSTLGFNEFSSLSASVMDDLKDILPWAECAAPIFGHNSSGRYNSYDDYYSKSDSSFRKNTIKNAVNSLTLENEELSSFRLSSYNETDFGGSPYPEIEYDDFKLTDGFNKKNPLYNTYKPKRNTNKTKGVYSVPDVGSHVWVFFHAGDIMRPVYFANVLGKDDWDGVYDELDYPKDYDNYSFRDKQKYDQENSTYRNKFLWNQKGGSIEISNTDHRERFTLTHFSGSYKEFNNQSTIELATNNDQKLVLGDAYYTWRGNKNQHVDGDFETIVIGDKIKKIGKPNRSAVQGWKEIVDEIADLKQLFEIKRAEKNSKTSTKQTRSGEFAPCPVCSGSGKKSYWVVDYTYSNFSIPSVLSNSDGVTDYGTVSPKNTAGSSGNYESGSNGKMFTFDCPTCGGSGKSPSSKDGEWDEESLKNQIKEKINENLIELAKIEETMGIGGSEISNVAKHKVETIGYTFNDFSSVRLDTVGKIGVSRVTINDGGTFDEEDESPLLEYVYNDDFPTGNYNLTVGNKYAVIVGSGGYKMKSYGPLDMSGSIVNVVGDQLHLASSNEIIIDGGKRLELTADILQIKQRDNKQVVIDSSLGVSRNLIVGGGAHIEGELTLTHVTAPLEIQQTLEMIVYGLLLEGLSFRCRLIGFDKTDSGSAGSGIQNGAEGTITLTSNSNDDKVRMYPHSHHFPNLPLNLTKTIDDLRNRAKDNNLDARNIAELVSNSLKM